MVDSEAVAGAATAGQANPALGRRQNMLLGRKDAEVDSEGKVRAPERPLARKKLPLEPPGAT